MRLRVGIRSSKVVLFGYFALLMLLGGFGLWVLPSWAGAGEIAFMDAMFTAVSAVAVTGLITINTAEFTLLGQMVILLLIQLGGLGIIAFSTIYLTAPRRKISLQRRAFIREYFIGSLEYKPRSILRSVVVSTLAIEAVVALALLPAFLADDASRPVFASIFHAISAFCNAGFSTFPDSLERYVASPAVLVPIMAALVLGGLGFVVYQDLGRLLTKRRHVLSLHSKLVLISSGILVVLAFVGYLGVERGAAFSSLSGGDRVLAAAFQAVTPRTAGFNTVPQGDLSSPGWVLTVVLMLVGGAPGSIAGGVKVTTLAIIVWAAIGRTDDSGDSRMFQRRIPGRIVTQAMLLIARALLLLVVALFSLAITENVVAGNQFALHDLIFEGFSAFGTVGLSTGITGSLSAAGKLVIMLTMFAGRVGLISLAIPSPGKHWRNLIDYPSGEVLVG